MDLQRPDFGNPPVFDQTLVKAQKAQIFEAVKSAGLDPTQFKWETVRSSEHQRPEVKVLRLEHVSGFYFVFNSTREGSHYFSRSPGAESRVDQGDTVEWTRQFLVAREWLFFLKQELETPDPWAMLEEGPLTRIRVSENENTPFTAEEIRRIGENVEEIKRFLFENENLKPGHRQCVEDRLKSLVEGSKKFGRKDWLALALGVLIQTVVGLALPQQVAQDVGGQLIVFSNVTFGWLSDRPLFFPPRF